jgi:hypothetical protein
VRRGIPFSRNLLMKKCFKNPFQKIPQLTNKSLIVNANHRGGGGIRCFAHLMMKATTLEFENSVARYYRNLDCSHDVKGLPL